MMKGSKSTDREYFKEGRNVLPNGDCWICSSGVYHSTDGPAVTIKKTGECEWWIGGIEMSEEEWKVKRVD